MTSGVITAMIITTVTIINVATVNRWPPPPSNTNSFPPRSERDYLDLLASLFPPAWLAREEGPFSHRQGKWISSSPAATNATSSNLRLHPRSRPDRLVPLLSQAILQARAYAQALPEPAAPLAVVAAPAISPSAANSLVSYSLPVRTRRPPLASSTAKASGISSAPASKNSMSHLHAGGTGKSSHHPSQRTCSPISANGC